MTDKKIQNYHATSYEEVSTSKIDLVHRKFLKFILGVPKSCPNLAVYGETGETPLSFKGYRLTLNLWHRVTNLPDTAMVKKALLENISLRTNWIMSIEKLINHFNLADTIGNQESFKKSNKHKINLAYREFWTNEISKPDHERLQFYRELKDNFEFEDYLNLEDFEMRKTIAKFRCSTHSLEIEKGRHRRPVIDRPERLCKQCNGGHVETEFHFLIECTKYDLLRRKYNLAELTNIQQYMHDTLNDKLGEYLIEAFSVRENGYPNLG